ncbi:CAZyme family AA7 [Paecilomyces variotii]|nr:CAZyme family AA7 [Paecilomyces variotii]
MAPFFANQSCDPFLPKEARCIIGTYIQYAVNASSALDVQKTIAFVKGHNIRLVIRNTGHDYLGKSTGAGAVGIWTHHMKDIEFLDYRSPSYTGKAVKVGAGVQIFEVNEAAHAQSLVVVGGNCQTVGIAGGYSQGGGHGQLASKFGLAADQVLEWEVVTADGDLVTASPSENADLYWALAGGGGGTYGVVLSMTSKAYPELQTATANLTFTNTGVSQDTFLEAVQTFVTSLNPILDAGGVSIWLLTNSSFSTTPTTLPGGTKAELQNLLSPSLKALEKSNITYTYFIDEFSTYYESYQVMNPVANITEAQMGGRLIPRSLIDSNAEALTTAFRRILASETGVVLSGISVNVSRQDAPDNAVNPFWRESVLDLVIGTPWSYTDWDHDLADRNLITNELLPILERLTPGGGGYLNEADSDQPHWQRVFYGSNYKALSAIKEKYDPDHIFYAVTGVGSEKWIQKADGRLCKL